MFNLKEWNSRRVRFIGVIAIVIILVIIIFFPPFKSGGNPEITSGATENHSEEPTEEIVSGITYVEIQYADIWADDESCGNALHPNLEVGQRGWVTGTANGRNPTALRATPQGDIIGSYQRSESFYVSSPATEGDFIFICTNARGGSLWWVHVTMEQSGLTGWFPFGYNDLTPYEDESTPGHYWIEPYPEMASE